MVESFKISKLNDRELAIFRQGFLTGIQAIRVIQQDTFQKLDEKAVETLDKMIKETILEESKANHG